MKKKIWLAMLGLMILTLVLNGCAYLMRTKETTVRPASGPGVNVTVWEVDVLGNEVSIYSGPLPARFRIRNGNPAAATYSYLVRYTSEDGEEHEFKINRKFNWWVLGSFGVTIWPVVIDVVTGSVFQIPRRVNMPINTSSESVEVIMSIGENLDNNPNLEYVGNIADE